MNPKASDSLHGLTPAGLFKSARRPTSTGGLWWEAPSPTELASQFPGFILERLLGRGGMSAVYLAHQPTLNRHVAIKVLPPELSEDPDRVERFQREAQTLARLHHEHIVEVHDAGTSEEGWIYFVMEYVAGPDLGQRLTRSRPPVSESISILEQVCHALEYAHAAGVIHRDIKPTNVLLSPTGRVKVADFGVAALIDDEPRARTPRLTRTGVTLGTVEYAAPEQLHGVGSDTRSDIFSLGVMAYELLTGELPRGAFDPPSRRSPVDPGFDSVILRALATDPARRWQEVSDFREALCAAHETALLVGSIELLGSPQAEVLERRYDEAMASVPDTVRKFIEEELVTEAGYRDNRSLDEVLARPGVSPSAVRRLVDQRLLRVDARGGVERLEISHDRLVNVVRLRRDGRREQERQTAAAEEARRQQELLRRRNRLVTVFAALAAVALVAAIYGRIQQQRALAREAEVQYHRDQAESVVNWLLQELRPKLVARQDYTSLRDVLNRVEGYYNQTPVRDDVASITNRIYFYEQKLLILRFQGRYSEEIPTALAAENLVERLTRRGVKFVSSIKLEDLPRIAPMGTNRLRPELDGAPEPREPAED